MSKFQHLFSGGFGVSRLSWAGVSHLCCSGFLPSIWRKICRGAIVAQGQGLLTSHSWQWPGWLPSIHPLIALSSPATMFNTSAAALLVALATSASARTFTVYNACPFTIWPAVFTDLNVGSAVPSIETGWEAPAWSSRTFDVPDNWKAGRIWARRNCNFATNPGPNSCLDGGCNGGLRCDSRTGTGVPPASLAEWTLSAAGGSDWYDVSLVDGYNLPMRISNNVGCPVAECAVDLGPDCPAALKGPFDSTGFPVGCKSDCLVDKNPANSKSCCSGQYNTPATCPPSGVPNYNYFKSRCPKSYVYAYDESSGTALWTCPSSKKANYTLTFCP